MEKIRQWMKDAPGATTIVIVVPITFVGLCLYWWLGPDTIWKLGALLAWLLFVAALVQICAAIDLGKH